MSTPLRTKVALAVCLAISLSSKASTGQEYVRVGSFNIANLGDTKEYARSLISLVNFTREMNADVICLQEVEPNDLGDDQVERFVNLLNKAAAFYNEESYDYIISTQDTGDEATAFLWRSPVTLESEDVYLLEHDEEDPRVFQRVPTYAEFRAGNYDFYVVNCHLYTKLEGTSSQGRGAEYDAIVSWLDALNEEEEKDAIVIGDFNRFLGGKSAWSKLMVDDHEDHFRFPLLEGIKQAVPEFNQARDEAPDDKFSTTTSKSKRIYDQILLSKGSYAEFTDAPEFGVHVGIITFDMKEEFKWCTGKWSDATALLSDHRPIWIRLRIDLPDDD